MELTWDMAGQYLFLAALFASVLGVGKVLVIITTIQWHVRQGTGKTPEYIKNRKKAVMLTIYTGLAEMLVGIIVMGLFLLPGVLDEEGQSVVLAIGGVFLVLMIALWFASNRFLKGLQSTE